MFALLACISVHFDIIKLSLNQNLKVMWLMLCLSFDLAINPGCFTFSFNICLVAVYTLVLEG